MKKVVVFRQGGSISSKSACTMAKVVELGMYGCIQEKVVVFGKKL